MFSGIKFHIAIALLSAILFINSLDGDLAYDDSRAIKSNQDLRPGTPISQLLVNDFWGTPLTHSGSHKSYRPLTVLSFRFNYYFNKLNPRGYHLVNLLIHSTVCLLFSCFISQLFHKKPSCIPFIASTLFATHPIHTEAVSSIVGRADCLSGLFFLLAILSYMKYCKLSSNGNRVNGRKKRLLASTTKLSSSHGDTNCSFVPSGNGSMSTAVLKGGKTSMVSTLWYGGGSFMAIIPKKHQNRFFLYLTLLFTACSMLSKETGLMAFGVCGVYHVFVHCKILPSSLANLRTILSEKRFSSLRKGLIHMTSGGIVLLSIRIYLMGLKAPDFATADNPAANSDSFTTRTLTFLFLPCFNFYLLLFPLHLSFDWSMESIPLIRSIHDIRNIFSLLFYSTLIYLVKILVEKTILFTSNSNELSSLGDDRSSASSNRLNGNNMKENNEKIPSLVCCSSQQQSSNNNAVNGHRTKCKSKGESNSVWKQEQHQEKQYHEHHHSKNGLNENNNCICACNSKRNIWPHPYNFPFSWSSCNSSSSSSSPFSWSSCNSSSSSSSSLSSTSDCGSSKSSSSLSSSSSRKSSVSKSSLPNGSGIVSSENQIWSQERLDGLWMSVALLIIPFIPATNLFFYVGFVIAERILYIPSMGFCLLIAIGFDVFMTMRRKGGKKQKRLEREIWWSKIVPSQRWINVGSWIALSIILMSFSLRTLVRNQDWSSEEHLYRSGITINPAKGYGNLGNVLSSSGRKEEAERCYRKALTYRSNMADVHYNLGILLQEEGKYEEALKSYQNAIRFRPRLAMAHLNSGIVLVHLGRKEEAIEAYKKCSQLDGTGLKDPKNHESAQISGLFNWGRLLAEESKYEEAIKVYNQAIDRLPSHYQSSQSLFNMVGEAYFKLGQFDTAEKWYRQALRVKSDHIPAHLTLAKLFAKMNKSSDAEEWFKTSRNIAPNDTSVYLHYAQFLQEQERFDEAANIYLEGIRIDPMDFELVFNGANALRLAKRNSEAEIHYKKAVNLRPKEVTSHMNLGAMLHLNGKLLEAESSYLEALKIRPNDPITRNNLLKLRHLLHKKI